MEFYEKVKSSIKGFPVEAISKSATQKGRNVPGIPGRQRGQKVNHSRNLLFQRDRNGGRAGRPKVESMLNNVLFK